MLTLLQPLDGAILLWIQNVLRGALDPLVCFSTFLHPFSLCLCL